MEELIRKVVAVAKGRVDAAAGSKLKVEVRYGETPEALNPTQHELNALAAMKAGEICLLTVRDDAPSPQNLSKPYTDADSLFFQTLPVQGVGLYSGKKTAEAPYLWGVRVPDGGGLEFRVYFKLTDKET